jgi:hypothetical protein
MLQLDGNVDVYKMEWNRMLKCNITCLLNMFVYLPFNDHNMTNEQQILIFS